MTEENPSPSVDLYYLKKLGRSYLLNQENITSELDETFRRSPECLEILSRYASLAELLDQQQEGPGAFELENIIYIYEIIILHNLLRTAMTGSIIIARETNTYVKSISNDQLPSLEKKIDLILNKLDALPVSIRDEIEPLTSDINNRIDVVLTILSRRIVPGLDEINTNITVLNESLRTLFSEASNLILEYLRAFNNRVIGRFDRLNRAVTNINVNIETNLRQWSTNIINNLTTELNLLLGGLTTLVSTQFTMLNERITVLFENLAALSVAIAGVAEAVTTLVGIASFQFAGLAAGLVELNGALAVVGSRVLSVSQALSDLQENFPSHWSEALSNLFKPLAGEVSDIVCLNIVGESYYRWDSITSYLPTLVFRFVEAEKKPYRKTTQIKVRLPYSTNTLPTTVKEDLKRRLAELGPLAYTRGPLRCNYVDHNSRWKTTMYLTSEEDAQRILAWLSGVMDYILPLTGLSFTKDRLRNPYTRLAKDLEGISYRRDSDEGTFSVYLSKVTLLINNADSPIVIWRRYE